MHFSLIKKMARCALVLLMIQPIAARHIGWPDDPVLARHTTELTVHIQSPPIEYPPGMEHYAELYLSALEAHVYNSIGIINHYVDSFFPLSVSQKAAAQLSLIFRVAAWYQLCSPEHKNAYNDRYELCMSIMKEQRRRVLELL